MLLITIDKHWFFLLNTLNKYINSLFIRNQQFSIKQKGL